MQTTRLFQTCFAAIAALAVIAVAPAAGAATATTTTLAITAGGSAATTVAYGTIVTLTASVLAGATPVTAGQINFCDATATYCEDIHILGSVNLTGTGSASYKFRPGPGAHSYKAVFLPSPTDATSASTAVPLTVSAPSGYPTATGIAVTGSAGNYTLTGTVGTNGPTPLAGNVAFNDVTEGDTIGTANLTANAGAGYVDLLQVLSANHTPFQPIIADFNNDGIPDFAVLYYGYNDYGTMAIYLGNGDGTFTLTGSSIAVGGGTAEVVQMVAGDFNGDGFPDLAVLTSPVNSNQVTSPAHVKIYLGDGTGHFTAGSTIAFTSNTAAASIAVIDINGDGILDLAVAVGDSVNILLGQGNGTFTLLSQTSTASFAIGSLAVADFNGDGIPDIAATTASFASSGSLEIFLGNGDGTFTAVPQVTSTGTCTGQPAVADFDGDGIPDVALPCTEEQDSFPTSVEIYRGTGSGNFTATSNTAAGQYGGELTVADLNGDGKPDLVVTGGGEEYLKVPPFIMTLLGNGDGTLTTAANGLKLDLGNYPNGVAIGDFNGDGATDILMAEVVNVSGGSFPYSYGFADVLLSESQTATASISGAAVLPAGSGTHQVTASYTGTPASTSTEYPIVAVDGTLTFNITYSANPAQYLTPVTINVTVTGPGLTPTGSVEFFNGTPQSSATELALVTLNSSGSASYTSTASTFTNGTHPITVAYLGDSNYNTGTSPVSTLTIDGGAPSSTVLSSSNLSIAEGLSVSFTAAVIGGGITPTGTVTFFDGGTQLGMGTVNSSGSASFVTSSLSVGSHSITATYSGDTAYKSSASTAITQTITPPVTPSVTVTPSATNIPTTQAFTVKVVVAGTSGNPTPTGLVALSGGSYSGQAELSGGTATFTIAAGALTTGSDILTASYTGVTPYLNASGSTTVTVYNAANAAVITSPTAGSTFTGSSVTFDWTAASGATGYYLWIGSTGPNSNNIYNSAEKTVTSYSFTAMPVNGETIYVRLSTNYNGTWVSNYYTYTAYRAPAAITSPVQGATFTGSSVTFDWTAAAGATGYYLWIGSTGPNSNNIYNSAEKTTTTYTFSPMPTNGETVYVRLSTNYNGTWVSNYYTYKAAPNVAATMTSPVAGTAFSGSSVTFNWTAESGATGYYLWIGSTGPNSNNIYNSAEKTTTSYTFTQMPTNGETIYVRLSTNYNGTWVNNYYTYTAAP